MRFSPKSCPLAGGIFPALVVAGSLPLALPAATLLRDSFNYPNGPLVSVSAGVWATHSGATGQVAVLSGLTDLSAAASEDVNALVAGQPYPATTNTVLYASFTVNFASLPSPSGEYF